MKQISQLTPEQEAKIPEYLQRFAAIGASTEPTNRALAEEALLKSYAYLAKKDVKECAAVPEIVWVDNPIAGAILAAQTAKGDLNVTDAEVQAQADTVSYGSFDAYWVSTYAFIAKELPVQSDELIDICIQIVKNCGVYWTFEGLIIACEKPTVIKMKDGALHSTEGPAFAFGKNCQFYYHSGVAKNSLAECIIAEELTGGLKDATET